MPFNGPIDGDWSNVDFTQPPWVAGVMTLSHTDTKATKTRLETIIENFDPTLDNPVADTQYVVSTYNKQDWSRAINGDTYDAIMAYDTSVNTGGIPQQQQEEITEGE